MRRAALALLLFLGMASPVTARDGLPVRRVWPTSHPQNGSRVLSCHPRGPVATMNDRNAAALGEFARSFALNSNPIASHDVRGGATLSA
jgi:hypothetical protein